MLNNKQFNSKLAGVIRSAKTQRDAVNVLILSGLEQYGEHGDTGQLSRLVAACVGVKSLPTTVIKDFIKECANVTYTKAKDGTMVFKKSAGESAPVVNMPTTTWYDWKGNDQHKPAPDFDINVVLINMIKRVEKAQEEGKVKAGTEEEVSNALATLRNLARSNAQSAIAEATH